MATGEIHVRGLFATPVAALVLPDAAARNAELERIILARRTERRTLGARPRASLMVLFPSFLLHAVRPYRDDGLRLSIAFNFGLYRPL